MQGTRDEKHSPRRVVVGVRESASACLLGCPFSAWSSHNGGTNHAGQSFKKTLDISNSHSVASILTFRHFSCAQFSVPSRIECRQVTPCRASSASVTKAGTTSNTFFQTQDVEFLFLSQRARWAVFKGSIAPKTPVLKLNRPLARKPPAAIASGSTQVACAPLAKPPGRRFFAIRERSE